MSNQPPPPKPKPGSLRDRIAAFENKPAPTPVDRPAPAPRPKPGGLAWKPRAPSPSSPPKASAPSSERSYVPERKTVGGMSASDAKESIGLGGSLKDRMAALQGKGAFGSLPSAAAVPPKPAPKWKPPPVVSPPLDESEGDAPVADTYQSIKSPSPGTQQSAEDEVHKPESAEEPTTAPEGDEEAEQPDPEEEERQRRAAIAARMARLGGARVGMSPPVFGRKPSIKRTETSKDEEAPEAENKDVVSPSDHPSLKSPPTEGPSEVAASDKTETEASTDYFAAAPPRKNSASSSLLSADSVSQPSKSPSSMPIPSVPRRAAPPRKKAAKSHSGSSIVSESQVDNSEQSTNTKNDVVPPSTIEIPHTPETQYEAESEKTEGGHQTVKSPLLSEGHYVTESPAQIEVRDSQPTEGAGDHGTREPEIYLGEPEETQEASSDTSASAGKETTSVEAPVETEVEAHTTVEPVKLAEEQDDDDDEEEAARRQRVAEKLAKMGGINPFAPRPPAKSLSTDSEIETEKQDDVHPKVDDHPVESASTDAVSTESSEQSATASTYIPINEPTTSDIISPTLGSSSNVENVKAGIVPEPVFPEDHEDGKY